MATVCSWCSLRHCDFPLTLSCISISSPNVVGTVAGANRSISGLMTALTVNMVVLDLQSYWWCKTKNGSRSTSGCCREHLSPCFDYKGCQWNKSREWCTKVDILHITVTYLTATANRKTRKQEPDIRTDGLGQTRRNPHVDKSGYGFGLPNSSKSGFWTGLQTNRTIFRVQTRTAGRLPRPVANTTETWRTRMRRRRNSWRRKRRRRKNSESKVNHGHTRASLHRLNVLE